MTVTMVVAAAILPRSSTTLHVTVIVSGEEPAVLRLAVEVVPLMDPALAVYE